jgi:hypothetical protein
MLNINRALNKDRRLRGLTGLNRKAFDELLPTFTSELEKARLMPPEQPRQRAFGGGRKGKLDSPAEKLFFILFYFKCYPTFEVAGVLFDCDASQACRWVHAWQPILEAALDQKQALPARKLESLEDFLRRCPDVQRIMIDGTERPIARPKDPVKQRLNYSGKKRRHTRKHLAAVDQDKRVPVLTKAREGKLHDKRFHDEDNIAEHIPTEIPIAVDLGFQGMQGEYDNIEIPHKKPRGGELTEQEKAENRELSRRRIKCENAFAGIKRYRAVSDVYRNRVTDFDDTLMLTATGLWNFYLMAA